MKKIFKSLIAMVLLLGIVISAVSCGDEDDGNIQYGELGFYYKLPVDMTKKSVPYATIYHSNTEDVTFMMGYIDREGMEENEIDPDIKITRYTDKFIYLNHYDGTEYNYDEESGKVTFTVEKDVSTDPNEEENVFYYHVLLRNYYTIYIVTMNCDVSLKDKYAPIFEEWASYVSIDG